MKIKFIKGTTYRGKLVNPGDILDVDSKDFQNFVSVWKDAVPYTEEAKAEPVAAAVAESPEVKKGKKL